MSGAGKGGLSLALPAASHKLLRALTGPTETKEMPASASSGATSSQSAQNLPAGSAPYSFALSNLLTMPPPPSPRNPGDKTFVDLHFMLGKYDEFMSRGELLHLLRARCAAFLFFPNKNMLGTSVAREKCASQLFLRWRFGWRCFMPGILYPEALVRFRRDVPSVSS